MLYSYYSVLTIITLAEELISPPIKIYYTFNEKKFL